MELDYMENDDTIIFSPLYNKPLGYELLLHKYKKIIFSNCILSDRLFEAYENNNLQNL